MVPMMMPAATSSPNAHGFTALNEQQPVEQQPVPFWLRRFVFFFDQKHACSLGAKRATQAGGDVVRAENE